MRDFGKICALPERSRAKPDVSVSREWAKPAGTQRNAIFDLQRSVGNQAMLRLLASGLIQAKLRISQPGDADEREADRIADRVVSSPVAPAIHRKCNCEGGGASCPACEEEEVEQAKGIHRKATHLSNGGDSVDGEFVQSMGPGQSMDSSTRNFMESRFGRDFGDVQIHTGEQAAQSARSIQARAYTFNRDVVFDSDAYAPRSAEGKKLLAHELTHVVQQSSPEASTLSGEMKSEGGSQRSHGVVQRQPTAQGEEQPAAPGRIDAQSDEAGPAEEQQPRVDRELDAALKEVSERQVARGAAIARDRKERHEYISAHLEWSEYDVPVDDGLRKMPAVRQPGELWMRVLQRVFPAITREDAAEILRRTGMQAQSVESDSIAEQIRTRDKIHFRTKYMRLLTEVYNEIVEDRVRASMNVDELLNSGPDMALEIFKDVGRGYYNGLLGFGQGLVDLPLAPINLYKSLRGGKQIHLVDFSPARAEYGTSYGFHYGGSIETGVQLVLTAVTGKLPAGPGAGAAAAASTGSRASRAVRLLSAWMKINSASAGATAIVQAEQALQDIARGYVIEDGKMRPLTEDEILARISGIAFGLHAAKSALGGKPGGSGREPAMGREVGPDAVKPPDVTLGATTLETKPGTNEPPAAGGAGPAAPGPRADENKPSAPPTEVHPEPSSAPAPEEIKPEETATADSEPAGQVAEKPAAAESAKEAAPTPELEPESGAKASRPRRSKRPKYYGGGGGGTRKGMHYLPPTPPVEYKRPGNPQVEPHQPSPADQARAEQARAAVEHLGRPMAVKVRAATAQGNMVTSGSAEHAGGGGGPETTAQVLATGAQIGHQFVQNASLDNGVPGQEKASHAEKQAAIEHPDQPLAVDKAMCSDCFDFFGALARGRGTSQVVHEPSVTWVFQPDGYAVGTSVGAQSVLHPDGSATTIPVSPGGAGPAAGGAGPAATGPKADENKPPAPPTEVHPEPPSAPAPEEIKPEETATAVRTEQAPES